MKAILPPSTAIALRVLTLAQRGRIREGIKLILAERRRTRLMILSYLAVNIDSSLKSGSTINFDLLTMSRELVEALSMAQYFITAPERNSPNIVHAYSIANSLEISLNQLSNPLPSLRTVLNTIIIVKAVLFRLGGLPKLLVSDIKITRIILTELDTLSPNTLLTAIVPFIQALADLQQAIDKTLHRPTLTPRIRSISQNSPVQIQFEDFEEDTIKTIEGLHRTRKEHLELMKLIEILQAIETELSYLKGKRTKQDEKVESRQLRINELKRNRLSLEMELDEQLTKIVSEQIRELLPNISPLELVQTIPLWKKSIRTIVRSSIGAQIYNK